MPWIQPASRRWPSRQRLLFGAPVDVKIWDKTDALAGQTAARMADTRRSKLVRPSLAGEPDRRLIGQRLRSLRLARNMSLREVAERAGLSRTFISLVERGETEIALSRFLRLADVYGVVVADLLANTHEPGVEYTPAEETHLVPSSSEGVEVRYLSSPSWRMQPFLVRLAPGHDLDALAHRGEEFVHCMEGSPTMTVDGQPHPMKPGDTLFIPEYAEHSYTNTGSADAVLVGAVLPPDRLARP